MFLKGGASFICQISRAPTESSPEPRSKRMSKKRGSLFSESLQATGRGRCYSSKYINIRGDNMCMLLEVVTSPTKEITVLRG